MKTRRIVLLELKKERNAKIIELYKQGLTQRKVADQIGVSITVVGLVLKMNDIPARRQRPRASLLHEEILRLYGQGLIGSQIARKIGQSAQNVSYHLRKNKIRSPILTLKKREEIIMLAEEDLTHKEIAEKAGVLAVTVGMWLREVGLRRRPLPSHLRLRNDKIIERAKKGIIQTKIAKEFKLSACNINQILIEAGVRTNCHFTE